MYPHINIRACTIKCIHVSTSGRVFGSLLLGQDLCPATCCNSSFFLFVQLLQCVVSLPRFYRSNLLVLYPLIVFLWCLCLAILCTLSFSSLRRSYHPLYFNPLHLCLVFLMSPVRLLIVFLAFQHQLMNALSSCLPFLTQYKTISCSAWLFPLLLIAIASQCSQFFVFCSDSFLVASRFTFDVLISILILSCDCLLHMLLTDFSRLASLYFSCLLALISAPISCCFSHSAVTRILLEPRFCSSCLTCVIRLS